jgi:hypothetical protein
MLSVFAVLFTASKTSSGSGSGAFVSAQPCAKAVTASAVTARAAKECLRIMEPPE